MLRIYCGGTVQHFTLAAIETSQVTAAGQRGPHYAVLVDVYSSGSEAFNLTVNDGDFVDFSNASLRGIVTLIEAVDATGKLSATAPCNIIEQIDDDTVATGTHSGVQGRINLDKLFTTTAFTDTA